MPDRHPEEPAPATDDSLLLLEGGHKIHLAGLAAADVERDLAEAMDGVTGNAPLIYLHPTNYGTNAVIVRPSAVVGIVAKMPHR